MRGGEGAKHAPFPKTPNRKPILAFSADTRGLKINFGDTTLTVAEMKRAFTILIPFLAAMLSPAQDVDFDLQTTQIMRSVLKPFDADSFGIKLKTIGTNAILAP